jgi:hypothetical protein
MTPEPTAPPPIALAAGIEQLKAHAVTLFVEATRATGILKVFSPEAAAEVFRAAQDAIAMLSGGN